MGSLSRKNSASPTRSVKPFAFTASRCGPRITQDTSCPASASRTAKWLPTAPAPKMQIRMRVVSLMEGATKGQVVTTSYAGLTRASIHFREDHLFREILVKMDGCAGQAAHDAV